MTSVTPVVISASSSTRKEEFAPQADVAAVTLVISGTGAYGALASLLTNAAAPASAYEAVGMEITGGSPVGEAELQDNNGNILGHVVFDPGIAGAENNRFNGPVSVPAGIGLQARAKSNGAPVANPTARAIFRS